MTDIENPKQITMEDFDTYRGPIVERRFNAATTQISDFWLGYFRGLCVNFYGESCMTGDHERFLAMAENETHDSNRRSFGYGYRIGVAGENFEHADNFIMSPASSGANAKDS